MVAGFSNRHQYDGGRDNKFIAEKIAVRLHFLKKYHSDGARVFDCCQGAGLVWKHIRDTHHVASYWGVDVKPRKGQITMNSLTVLGNSLKDNVIDVDTYGEPWEHWLKMLPNITQPTTVFLTWTTLCLMGMSTAAKRFVFGGDLQMPPSLYGKLWDYANACLLAAPEQYGLEIVECCECTNTSATRYIGVHLRPVEVGEK